MLSAKFVYLLSKCRTGAIIIRGLYTFYALFEIHLCTVTYFKALVYVQQYPEICSP